MTLMLVQQLEYILQLIMNILELSGLGDNPDTMFIFTLNISNKRLMSAVYKELSHIDIKNSESKDLIFK